MSGTEDIEQSTPHPLRYEVVPTTSNSPNLFIQSSVQLTHPQIQINAHNFLFTLLLLCSVLAFAIVTILLIHSDLTRISQPKIISPSQDTPGFSIDQQNPTTKLNTSPAHQQIENQKDNSGVGNQTLSPQVRMHLKNNQNARLELHKYNPAKLEQEQGDPVQYSEIESLSQLSELPFCLVVWGLAQEAKSKIMESIEIQNYSNIRTLFHDKNYKILSDQSTRSFVTSDYFETHLLITQECLPNSIILFLRSPLRSGALRYLNDIFNKYNIWLVYQRTDQSLRIISFYSRVYELVAKKDFTGKATPLLKDNKVSMPIQVFAMMKICASHRKSIEMSRIFVNEQKDSHFSAQLSSQKWSKLFGVNERLSQDFDNQIIFDPKWKKAGIKKEPLPGLGLSRKHMLRAIQFQQIWYLPRNHSIALLEHSYYNRLYDIDKYRQVKLQVPFCVTILNYNNVQNDRYRKLMASVLEQEYQNYRLVVIDDFSTDGSLERIKQFVQKRGFPSERIIYVANTQRLYATYNIMNAVYNFCDEGDIQLLLDGDDELIGRYAFSVLNSAYQKENSVWSVYSNYKSNLYHFGRSRAFTRISDYQVGGRRNFVSYMGPIRTWRVQLMYHLPLSYQIMQNGRWLDTAYDDNIQYSLLELATPERVRYIPQILYEYNRKYGGNDDSTPAKLRYRNQTYTKQILTRQPLKPLVTLAESAKLKDMAQIFDQDRNIKFRVI